MKNEGWMTVKGRKLKLCSDSPHERCAVFTHNRQVSLDELFRNKFGVEVVEDYSLQTLSEVLGVTMPENLQNSKVASEWCGLNLGDGCNHASNPNVGSHHTICRIGCVGDLETDCRYDNFALGVGVSSCQDRHGCYAAGANTPSLHYAVHVTGGDGDGHGSFAQTAFIYVH